MTRIFVLALLVPFVCLAGDLSLSASADETAEPPLKYSIQVGNKTVTAGEGEAVQIDGTFTNPKVTITPQSHRVFPYQGISFKYPRSFTFEADFDQPDVKMWTLSGTDLVIMYFVMKERVTPGEYAKEMIEQFGKENAKVIDANATITLGKEKLSGTSLRITVATHSMVMDIYRIPSRGSNTKLLVFQDSLDDADEHSKEGKQTLAEIKSSFAVEP